LISDKNSGKGRRQKNCFGTQEREFLDSLIARSGVINRLIMRLYLDIDILGLDRWYAYIQRLKGKKRRVNLLSYWPLRIIERISAVYVGGSLTKAEQETFGRICRVRAFKLSRWNAIIFGTLTGIIFFTSGEFTLWLSSFGTIFDTSLGLTSWLLYSMGVVSVSVDLWRAVDSFARQKAHMPFGIFPLAINSTTFLKRIIDRLHR
jgi:hypothetical protein